MITNLEIVDDGTAKAFGEKYDIGKVLEASIAFLRGFTRDIVAAAPHVRPTLWFPGDGERLDPLDEDGYARLRRETIGPGNPWDVEATGARVDVGTFRLRLYLRGRDDLRRYGQTSPVMIDDGPWEGIDPVPLIEFTPTQGRMPLFEPKPFALLMDLVRRHAPAGTVVSAERNIPMLRFLHGEYGLGHGDILISLLTIPVEP